MSVFNMYGKSKKMYAKSKRRKLKFVLAAALVMTAILGVLSGCSNDNVKNKEKIEYTVVEDADLPVELKKIINERKDNTLRLTYATKDYTYIVAGYGTKETSGYSIKVNDVYLGDGSIYADVSLLGPATGESVSETKTTPYIVIKIEKREETVIFKM